MEHNFYDPTIQAAFLSIIGAIIAAFGAAYLTVLFTSIKEKKKHNNHLRLQTENLISILTESILPKIELLKENCDELELKFKSKNDNESIIYRVEDSYVFNMDLLNIVDKYTILEILENREISPSIFFNLLVTIESFKHENTLSISTYFDDCMTLYFNETIKGLNPSSPEYPEEEKKFDNNMKMLKDVTCNSFKQLSKSCTKTILDINAFTTSLKSK